jgi:RNA 3'-phosphate cyclase
LIEVDGSMMEGGGQVLRIAVTYSAVMGVPVRVRRIRAGRRRPGLRPQHLTTLKAVEEICRAEAKGLDLGSTEIEFHPNHPRGGVYELDIGTAGSISLLLQCVAPVAAFSDSPTDLRIRGGTAVRWAPPIRILDNVVWEAFRQMGLECSINIEREGFYPRGGGIVEAIIKPVSVLRPLVSESQGEIRLVRGTSVAGRLPRHVAERQASSAEDLLEEAGYKADVSIKVTENQPLSPGSAISLWALSQPKVFMSASSLGERGKPAEKVGAEATRSLIDQLRSGAAVDMHTGDNLVLWCSLAEGDSVYTTSRLTMHTRTAIELAKIFTGTSFKVEGEPEGVARIRCAGVGLKNRNI